MTSACSWFRHLRAPQPTARHQQDDAPDRLPRREAPPRPATTARSARRGGVRRAGTNAWPERRRGRPEHRGPRTPRTAGRRPRTAPVSPRRRRRGRGIPPGRRTARVGDGEHGSDQHGQHEREPHDTPAERADGGAAGFGMSAEQPAVVGDRGDVHRRADDHGLGDRDRQRQQQDVGGARGQHQRGDEREREAGEAIRRPPRSRSTGPSSPVAATGAPVRSASPGTGHLGSPHPL